MVAPDSTRLDSYEQQRQRALATLKLKENDEPCTAVEAWALASSLTDEDAVVTAWWRKLVGRPAEVVRAHSRELREAKPELRQTLITEFAKTHAAQPRRKAS